MFQGVGRALMERGWVLSLRVAHTELWPPRCFSQNHSLVHRSPGLFALFQEKLRDLCLQYGNEVMWDPGFCQPSTCHNRTSSGSHSENGVSHSPMKASQGSYFPTDSPSSGVMGTGPQVTTCPPTCSCQEGVPPLKSHFHPYGDEGLWAAQGGLPVAARLGVASSRLPGVTSGALLVKDQRHRG